MKKSEALEKLIEEMESTRKTANGAKKGSWMGHAAESMVFALEFAVDLVKQIDSVE